MASGYLIDDPKYSFLKDLGLQKTNNGVYDGQKWGGSGQVSKTFSLIKQVQPVIEVMGYRLKVSNL